MTAYANRDDLPVAWKPKRVVFYRFGLKIYGQIPYVLQRKLRAKFVSSEVGFLGGRIFGPTLEDNYTVIRFCRPDGSSHPAAAVQSLVDWLLADKGCEWAFAAKGEFERTDLELANWGNVPPETWIPDLDESRLLEVFA